MTVDEAVLAFRECQQQLARLKEELRPAIDECNAGHTTEMNVPELLESVEQQLAKEGITG